ncbi:MAG TPA: 16S rRNA (adenine(1518)-N(6)/adenine(1519)-N(6))-dimethyltransferase RsmA [Steroidobacteraceae bacterium]|nr:16S rRNA (adenine(1518)-N(6)/adenine(1519)-N(6))-dimethyltransferase RsmA [Steroidobacteraceae bacterium]
MRSQIRPRKRFGQHFLHDQRVITRIVDAIAPTSEQRIVEIGPGLGALTLPLLTRIATLDVIEIDRDAIRELRTRVPDGALRIHEGDVLNFDIGSLRQQDEQSAGQNAQQMGRRLRLVGNLPYNISTPLLFKLIAQREHIEDMHFMLQKEVVDRMAAQPDTAEYGRLTVMLAPWVAVESLFDIGPGAFRPPPRVVSSVARLKPHAQPPFAIHDLDVFSRVVAAAFAQRRKTMRNALRGLISEDAFARAGVDPGARGETLSPAEFARLAGEHDPTPADNS